MVPSKMSSAPKSTRPAQSKPPSKTPMVGGPPRPHKDEKDEPKRSHRGLVDGMGSLSMQDNPMSGINRHAPSAHDSKRRKEAPWTERHDPSSHDSGRRKEDRNEALPSARGAPKDTHISSHGNGRSRAEDHSSFSYHPRNADDPRSPRRNHAEIQNPLRVVRGDATAANPGNKTAPSGPSAAAPTGGSTHVTRSKAEGKKVSADRVEKPTKKKASKTQPKPKPRPKSKSPSPPTTGRNSGPFDVVIYHPRPREGNTSHWSFFVENNDEGRGLIRDVVGTAAKFTRNRRDNVKPENSELFRERISAGEIDDVKAFEDILDSQPVCNDVSLWSCQDYILESLDELIDQDMLQGEFGEIRQTLKGLYNRGRSSESN